MPENPYIPPLGLPGPGQRLRYAGQESGSPMIDGGPVTTRPPHVIAETNLAPKRAAEYSHPWKIEVVFEETVPQLYVHHGAISVLDWSAVNLDPEFFSMTATIGLAGLVGNPFLGTTGKLALAVNKTYGVWLRLGRSFSNVGSSDTDEFLNVFQRGFANNADIIVDETAIDPSTNMPYSASYGYIFIGQVAITTGGDVTIKQWRRSDVVIPFASTLPNNIVHPEEEPPP